MDKICLNIKLALELRFNVINNITFISLTTFCLKYGKIQAAAPSLPQSMPHHNMVDNENPYEAVTAVISKKDNSIRQSFSRRISRTQALQMMRDNIGK